MSQLWRKPQRHNHQSCTSPRLRWRLDCFAEELGKDKDKGTGSMGTGGIWEIGEQSQAPRQLACW